MKTENDVPKQITAADIDGFVNTATAILSHDKIEQSVRDTFDSALIEIAGELGWSRTRPEAMRLWLSDALTNGEQAEADERPEAMPKPQTLSVAEMVGLGDTALRVENIHGDLERVVDEIDSPGCQSTNGAENLIRLMVLLYNAEDDDRGILIETIIGYAYARTEHGQQSLAEFKESLFKEVKADEC